jgi:hypothetical protein
VNNFITKTLKVKSNYSFSMNTNPVTVDYGGKHYDFFPLGPKGPVGKVEHTFYWGGDVLGLTRKGGFAIAHHQRDWTGSEWVSKHFEQMLGYESRTGCLDLLVDANGKLVQVNSGAMRMTGTSGHVDVGINMPTDYIAKMNEDRLIQDLAPEDNPSVAEDIAQIIHEQYATIMEPSEMIENQDLLFRVDWGVTVDFLKRFEYGATLRIDAEDGEYREANARYSFDTKRLELYPKKHLRNERMRAKIEKHIQAA